MKNNYLAIALTLGTCMMSLSACHREEEDFAPVLTPESVVMEGYVTTSGGEPLSGIPVTVDYSATYGIANSLLRHKAAVTTNQAGYYKLWFDIREDEDEIGSYHLKGNLRDLDPNEFILFQDMTSVTAGESFFNTYYRTLTAGEHITNNAYVPRKRMIDVELIGCEPIAGQSDFSVASFFPWGTESGYTGEPANEILDLLNTKYYISNSRLSDNSAKSPHDVLRLPFALNEMNVVNVWRQKNGKNDYELIPVYVTADTPEKITIQY